MFSPEELNRYNRQLILPEIGLEGQQKLKQARVLVIGAGGLGCPALQYLAAAGVGKIGIVDFDEVSESNLHRQILYTAAEVGQNKAAVAARKLAQQNPHMQLQPYPVKLSPENVLDLLQDYDLVLDGTDNFPTRYLVNDACHLLNKPLVFGSIFRFEGQVTVFHYQNGPTYRCLFPEQPPRDEIPTCSEAGVLGVLPGIIGALQANEALKIIIGHGEVLSGKLFIFNALTLQTNLFDFPKTYSGTPALQRSYEDNSTCEIATEVQELTAAELRQWQQEQADFQLIDVREPAEYAQQNLNGLLLPLSNLEKLLHQVQPQKKVVVHCQSGARSQRAIRLLQQHFPNTQFFNLTGGIMAAGLVKS